jgi:arsenate reductase
MRRPPKSRKCGRTSRQEPDGLHDFAGSVKQASGVTAGDFDVITVYGIKNCDTMKKARAWLDTRGVKYAFHDYKTAGIERSRLEGWVRDLGWEALLNKAGTTFRKLDDTDKAGLNAKKAVALMLEQPSMIKRPVLDLHGTLLVGFKPELYEKAVRA